MKSLKIFAFLLFCVFTYDLRLMTYDLYAQEDNKIVIFTKQIIEAKTNSDLYAPFLELKELYFKDHRYSQFVEFLKSLATKKEGLMPFVNYYIALSRYQQLKYLETTQGWDEYFNQGNTYRQELVQSLEKAVSSTTAREPLNISGRLLNWEFHKDMEDIQQQEALIELSTGLEEYLKDGKDISVIKEVADKFLSYQLKGKAKELYKIYVERLMQEQPDTSQIEKIAQDFYGQQNLDLAEALYDGYALKIVQIKTKEEVVPKLFALAEKFIYKDEGIFDALYAEKIFRQIEEIGGKEALSEEMTYLRGLNLEKAKEYHQAKEIYLDLCRRFPESSYSAEAKYKAGIIAAYVDRDINTARDYFTEITEKKDLSPEKLAAFYQLGLFSQWQEDNSKAKEYYEKLIQGAVGSGFGESVVQAQERLNEIKEGKPLAHNFKMFLNLTFGEAYQNMDMSKVDLKAHPRLAKKEAMVNVTCIPSIGATGCLQVEFQYLWSGDMGTASVTSEQAVWNTSYKSAGTKVINVVAFSSGEIVDRAIDIVDVR